MIERFNYDGSPNLKDREFGEIHLRYKNRAGGSAILNDTCDDLINIEFSSLEELEYIADAINTLKDFVIKNRLA